MPYKKGESGNLKGRPRDITSTRSLRQSIVNEMPEIIRTIIEKAKGGDMQAAKILTDRVLPAIKPQSLPINIPIGKSIGETSCNVLAATLNGEIPGDVGANLFAALASHIKIIEANDLITRIEALEAAHESKK